MKPTVSVIIPNYNYGHFIAESIESVLNQTYPCQEIIVVDDGSTDNSLEILAGHKEKIRVIKQKNAGVGAARNVGAKIATGEILAFLDADDIWFPDKIEKQIEKLIEDKEVKLVSCGMQEFDVSGKIIKQHLEFPDGSIPDKMLTFRGGLITSGSVIIVKRELFEKIGGFDERKELHPSEDWEFCYRAACAGKTAVIPEILVNYRNHGGNAHLKIPQMEKSMLLFYKETFENAPPEIEKFKRESYGNLYSILAGSYFQTKNYPAFIRSAAKSLWLNPKKISHYSGFPFRFLKRRLRNFK